MPLAQLTVLVSALVGWSDITIQPPAAIMPRFRIPAQRREH